MLSLVNIGDPTTSVDPDPDGGKPQWLEIPD